jgi:hypothetical protein
MSRKIVSYVLAVAAAAALCPQGGWAATLKLPLNGKSHQSAVPDLLITDESKQGVVAIQGVSTNGVGLSGASGAAFMGVLGTSAAGMGVAGVLTDGQDGGSQGANGLAAVNATDNSPSGAYTYGLFANSPNNVAVRGISNNASASFVGGREGTGRCNFYGSSGWECSSDRNLKEDFRAVDARAVLRAVAAMPEWNYRFKHGNGTRFVGPTAQDFHAAFGLGSSDTTINTANAQGVALVAIKALAQTVADKDAEIARLEQSLAATEKLVARQDHRVAALERLAVSQARQAALVSPLHSARYAVTLLASDRKTVP